MQLRPGRRWLRAGAGVLTALLVVTLMLDVAFGQQRRQRATPMPSPPIPEKAQPKQAPEPTNPVVELPRETVQADISTRRVAVTSTFSGTEVVVFGAVDNSRQTSPEAGLYDIVVLVTGAPTRVVARKKSRVLGVWLNTDRMTFTNVPSYYAIISTRPIDEIASSDVLKSVGLGFDYVPMTLGKGEAEMRSAAEIKEFRDAIVRLKRKDRLFTQDQYGVAFIGRSLFRASVDVPANVTIGRLETRVLLFKNQELLHQYSARIELEREGLEDALHAFAFRYPLYYGIFTVLLALGSGLLASTLFRKGAH